MKVPLPECGTVLFDGPGDVLGRVLVLGLGCALPALAEGAAGAFGEAGAEDCALGRGEAATAAGAVLPASRWARAAPPPSDSTPRATPPSTMRGRSRSRPRAPPTVSTPLRPGTTLAHVSPPRARTGWGRRVGPAHTIR